MSSPYLHLAADAEAARQEAEEELIRMRDEMAGIINQRDELREQLTKALEENCELRKKLNPHEIYQ